MQDPASFFVDLVRAETRLYNLVDARVRAAHDGLTLGRLWLSYLVGQIPGCRVADLAAAIDITVGAASKAVDRLEESGYCRRRPHPTDRRASVLELTADGERVVAQAWPTVAATVQDLVGDVVPAADLATTARTLAALDAALARVQQGQP